jgi:hypothetical protein
MVMVVLGLVPDVSSTTVALKGRRYHFGSITTIAQKFFGNAGALPSRKTIRHSLLATR